jgi:SAM-dependent methyltransferase
MTATTPGRRTQLATNLPTPQALADLAQEKASRHLWFEAMDHIAEATARFPQHQVPLLALAWELYVRLRAEHGDRWNLYQGRFFDVGIGPGEKVLDLGSGHHPFPYATHLSDISLTDGSVGRAGSAFQNPRGLPCFECGAEAMPFGDKEFDFIYCSHVLEHSTDPMKACEEIMRVGRRGYIETPSSHKDLWMGSARISNHTMAVDWIGDVLVFRPYTPIELDGLGISVLMDMHCGPQTDREKAFAASIWLFADKLNNMVYWERRFRYSVRTVR